MLYYFFTVLLVETKKMFVTFSEVFAECERTGCCHQSDFLTQNNTAIYDNNLEDDDSDSELNKLLWRAMTAEISAIQRDSSEEYKDLSTHNINVIFN